MIVPSLQGWLALHAGQLQTLDLHVTDYVQLELPLDKLTQLQHLKLQGCRLLLPGYKDWPCSYPGAGSNVSSKDSSQDSSRSSSRDSSSEGFSHAAQPILSSLRRLELHAVQLSSVSSLLQLTRAPQLTRLSLSDIKVIDLNFSSEPGRSNSPRAVGGVAEAVSGVLQQLPRLKVLRLPRLPFSDAAVQQTTALRELQDIAIEHVEKLPLCNLQHLCSSITALQLLGNLHSESPSLPPELPQLTRLLRLELKYCEVPPEVLGSVPQLQSLHIAECGLLPHEPEQRFATAGTAALLRALSKLTRLQDLKLCLHGLDCDSIAPQMFSALTASSHLTRLEMSRYDYMTIPEGAAQHMFPPGRQMQSLRRLALVTNPQCFHSDEDWCIDGAGLQCITQACPVLESLEL
jgi:Leucine-rich repeat (LRR) protein